MRATDNRHQMATSRQVQWRYSAILKARINVLEEATITRCFLLLAFGQKHDDNIKRIAGSRKLDESRKFAIRLFEFRTGNVCTRIEEGKER